MEWYIKVVRDNYANFNGRARRKEYWMFQLFFWIFAIGVMVVDLLIEAELVLYYIYVFALLLPNLAVAVRRLHDTDRSGWWLLIIFLPIFGYITVFIFQCLDSSPGTNKYGPNPKSAIISSLDQETVIENDTEYEPEVNDSNDRDKNELETLILTVESGENKGSFYPIDGETKIGRAHDNDIVIDLKTISGYHCKISAENGQYILSDLDSTNGTLVDGQNINKAVLTKGSIIELSKVRLKVT